VLGAEALDAVGGIELVLDGPNALAPAASSARLSALASQLRNQVGCGSDHGFADKPVMDIRDPDFGEPFELHARRRGEAIVVELVGAFGFESKDRFESELQKLERETTERGSVVVDLRQLTFIDSTGLQSLIIARDRFRTAGFDFAVASARGQVLRALDLSGLNHELTMLQSLPASMSKRV
jgi:anti-anti-sigma factor